MFRKLKVRLSQDNFTTSFQAFFRGVGIKLNHGLKNKNVKYYALLKLSSFIVMSDFTINMKIFLDSGCAKKEIFGKRREKAHFDLSFDFCVLKNFN